ncbi:type II RES/Xre toxin-antitoxin system antitoxin [Actimicrobium antarcticum]|uniref:Antitoxin Xre/MbcA/ParS-like toxin-binding domain-containing protein n=1 Tax=Actimicrobium antarcticum TaxID=1051899 RepID=A0ABP7T0I2_9BURK
MPTDKAPSKAAIKKTPAVIPHAPSGNPTSSELATLPRSVRIRAKPSARRLDDTLFTHLVTDAPLAGFAAIHTIRVGYSARMMKAASQFFGVSDARIQGIAHVPASTASRLDKNNARIDSGATERLYRMGMVTRMAIEVFGSKLAAIDWMRQPNRALGETAPLDLMDTEPGAVSVRQVLNAIATGGAA